MNAQQTLKRFFWIAFAVFLLASIPHVAYFFRAFEPEDGAWYWLIAYAIAFSIDITVFLLSLTVAELRQKRVNGWIVSSVWVFILLLAGLSWFMNWEYATQFTGSMLAKPEVNGFVNLVNPVIASCFQALAIAYTWISDKIAQSEHQVYSVHSELTVSAQELTPVQELTARAVNQVDSESAETVNQVDSESAQSKPLLSTREQIVYWLANDTKTSAEIATLVGVSKSYVSKVKKEGSKP